MSVIADVNKEGPMYYSFNNNGVIVLSNELSTFYDQGELIEDMCLPGGVDTLTVQNTSNNGIEVEYEFSTDGGATYGGAYLDCDIAKNRFRVDNNGSGYEGCGCESGQSCTWNIVRKDRVDATKKKCVKATIADYNYAAGYFSMSINSGSTVVDSRPSNKYERQTTAVLQCYDDFTEVKMFSDNTDAAFVNLEFSEDGGANWDSGLFCENCGGTECLSYPGGLFLVVDGNEQPVTSYHQNFPLEPEGYCNCLEKECTISYFSTAAPTAEPTDEPTAEPTFLPTRAPTAGSGPSQITVDNMVCKDAPKYKFENFYTHINGRAHVDFDENGTINFDLMGGASANVDILLTTSIISDYDNLPTNFDEGVEVFIGGANEPVIHASACPGCAPDKIVSIQDTPLIVDSAETAVWITKTGNTISVGSEVDTLFEYQVSKEITRAIFTFGYDDLECEASN
jgi:hypothetical protein